MVTHSNPTTAQKRAYLQKALIANPNDANLRKMLLYLCPTPAIQEAGQHGVFISYTRSDELFAIDLAADLRLGGVNVWMDMMDVSYDEEGDWGTEISNALHRCGLMLMIVSPESVTSGEQQRERDYFIANGKIILPVIYQAGDYDLRAYLPPVDCRKNYARGLQTLLRLFVSRPENSTR